MQILATERRISNLQPATLRNFDFSRPIIFLKNGDEQKPKWTSQPMQSLQLQSLQLLASPFGNKIADEPRANARTSAEGTIAWSTLLAATGGAISRH